MVQVYYHRISTYSNPLGKKRRNVPSNLLHNFPNEGSSFAQVTLSSADSGLGFSGLGFLHGEEMR
jgi:hypothetical protein